MKRSFAAFLTAAMLAVAVGIVTAGPAEAQAPRHADRDHDRGDRRPPAHNPRVGEEVRSLPRTRVTVSVGRDRYYFHGGSFYRLGPRNTYVVVRAPLGARLRDLPPGYVSFVLGSRRYFYLNFAYYLWDPVVRQYVVVDKPEGSDSALATATDSATGKMFIYPNDGQSDEQRDRDRYECYQWAVQQTGYDPSEGAASTDKGADYRRAITACLEGRGYTVK